MKSAEDWFETFKELHLDGNNKYVNDTTKDIPDLIKKIQDDAYKQAFSDICNGFYESK